MCDLDPQCDAISAKYTDYSAFLRDAHGRRFGARNRKQFFHTAHRPLRKIFFVRSQPQTQCIPQIARIFVARSTSFPAARQKPL
jgi:hypothetical protein